MPLTDKVRGPYGKLLPRNALTIDRGWKTGMRTCNLQKDR